MPLIVNTNVSSLNAQRHLGVNTNALSKSMEKLSSGFRINRAADDAAGLQLSETLRSQIRGSKKALDNVQDGINMLNIVDGAYGQVTENLQRMRELTVQAANDTYAAAQRSAMEAEIDQLMADIDRIAAATEFNGVKLMDGSRGTDFVVQLGANDVAAEDQLNIASAAGTGPFASAAAAALQASLSTASLNVNTASAALAAITVIDSAMTRVNSRRGMIGSLSNRLEGAANNLSVSIENLSSSESRIRNVDVAAESANLTRNQILQQASAAMLSQANQTPQLALQLLKG
ncbi:MAG TPA: flagellin [Coleofasciculaceae cyanobacterium]|jgi:flagellin